jgi:phospholipid/cholesterol/gamma-HCH transport system permease protein
MPPLPSGRPAASYTRLTGMFDGFGRLLLNKLVRIAGVTSLLSSTFLMVVTGGTDGQRISLNAVVRRITEMGPSSLGLTAQFGLSIGLVFGIWLENWLEWADLLELAISEATTVMVEQVAPLFVAIMVAAHSGSALAADLGSMVAAREVDALRTLGLSPERMLVAPSILGALLAVPLLTLTMIGGILLTFAVYLQFAQIGPAPLIISFALNAMEPTTIATALGKSALFGPLIVAIAAHHGLAEQPTTRLVGFGVAKATVTMISTILLLNALLSLIF